MWSRILILGAALVLAPLGARAADLVVWWEKGFYPQEDQAVREIIAAFEQKSGKQVELVFHPIVEIQDEVRAALAAGHPPDFFFGFYSARILPEWAHDGRLVDLGDALGPLLDVFDPDAIAAATMFDGRAGRRGLYALPMGRTSNHVHVWRSLLEQAGFKLHDIPSDWDAFWSFWCDEVQPAVRRATGRDDIWGVGLPMSVTLDTHDQFTQFQLAYQAPWVAPDGRLQVDDAAVHAGLTGAMTSYTKIWRKGCTPPASLNWDNYSNNKAFLEQKVVMTVNETLSIPNELRLSRLDDYRTKAVTVDWPHGAKGQPLLIDGAISRAVVFRAGGHQAVAEEFVRFLVEGGWLAHWLNFAGDRQLPPMRKLIDQPFWLDPGDPHRMHAAIQMLTRTAYHNTGVRDHEWRSTGVWQENVWGTAVHRVVADGITPEQAVDDAIARIKQILSE